MSKIEKALNRAREAGLQVVPLSDSANRNPAGTAVVAQRTVHPETIPQMAKNEVRMLGETDLVQRGIIRPQQGEEPALQVIRELRTKIVQLSRGQNAVTLVTSVTKGCGGSFIARNLGAAFALDVGKTALLIDCNLADPSVHELLRSTTAPGLTDYLENPSLDLKDIIHPLGIARFRLIPAGKRSETAEELFTSRKMKQLMDTVRERYPERFIVMDGPPMSRIADIRILSELADFVLVVAGYGRTTNTQIAKCLGAIGEKKLLGLVFNEEPRIPRIR
jgi:protein-tyrosine kinase